MNSYGNWRIVMMILCVARCIVRITIYFFTHRMFCNDFQTQQFTRHSY